MSKSESQVVRGLILHYDQTGKGQLFINSSGVAMNPSGVPVRFGLGNTSAKVNSVIKSSDLIGWTTKTIKREDVGKTVAVFTSLECKREGWAYTGQARERAQLAWLQFVRDNGGIAEFITEVPDE